MTPDEPAHPHAENFQDWEPHLEELRKRLIAVLVVFSAATAGAFVFSSRIAAFLLAPLEAFQLELYTFAPAEKFIAYLHLAAWTGTACAAPFFCLQAALFVWPGLRGREFHYALAALFAVPVLFALGAALAYSFLAPAVFGFFLSFMEGDGVRPLWGFQKYLALLFDLMLAAGIAFQMPLALLTLLATGAVRPESVARCRAHIILLIFFLAALLTPPDVISQLLLGIPLYLFFEAALALGRLLRR